MVLVVGLCYGSGIGVYDVYTRSVGGVQVLYGRSHWASSSLLIGASRKPF